MLAVEGLGKICKVHIESLLPFGTLPNNISRHENMIDTTPSPPETCQFLAKFKVMMTFGRILLGVDNGKKDRKKRKGKRATDMYQNCIKKKNTAHPYDNFLEQKRIK